MHPLLEDPFVAAKIEAAVAPYAERLSPEQIAWMKDQMAASLADHDKAATLLRRARPIDVDESGEVRKDGAPAAAQATGTEGAKVVPIRAGKKAG
ncbi:MAG: hypothetical protein U0359_10460 [Byssovorax sp.]